MQSSTAPLFVQMMPLIFMLAIIYFLFIRPQQKAQKEHEAMIKEIKKNDEIVTKGGIHGTVVNIKEKTFVLRVDDNAKIEIEKFSVGNIKKSHD